ncbi:MAG: hypothetical protein J6K33_01955 [Alistipes sp.]|nr:hypothetical protein [Alistipes sp.]
MDFREIKGELLRAAELIGDYEQSRLSIERDTALELIRKAYEALRFCDTELQTELPPLPASIAEPEVVSAESAADAEPEVEVEIIMAEQDDEPLVEEQEPPQPIDEVAEEPVAEESLPEQTVENIQPEVEPEPQPEPAVEVEPEPAEPEPGSEPEVTPAEPEPKPKRVIVEPSLFGDDELWSRPAKSRRRIRALYSDDAEQEHAPRPRRKATVEAKEEVKEEAKVEIIADIEPPQVIADTISTPQVIADTIPMQPSVGESGVVSSLRGAISVGDRFMLIRELFGGNEAQYESTIDVLEGFDNLDDCIIYIAENFTWRASSVGAKLVMDLLQRKLS